MQNDTIDQRNDAGAAVVAVMMMAAAAVVAVWAAVGGIAAICAR